MDTSKEIVRISSIALSNALNKTWQYGKHDNNSICQRFIRMMLTTGLSYAGEYYKSFYYFFQILIDLIQKSPDIIKVLIDERIIYKLIDFTSNSCTALDPSDCTIKARMNDVSFEPPLELLRFVICSCSTYTMRLKNVYPDSIVSFNGAKIELPEDEIDFIFSDKFEYLEVWKYNGNTLKNMLYHIAWHYDKYIKNIVRSIIKCISDDSLLIPYKYDDIVFILCIEILTYFLSSNDDYMIQVTFLSFIEAEFNGDTLLNSFSQNVNEISTNGIKVFAGIIELASKGNYILKNLIKEKSHEFGMIVEIMHSEDNLLLNLEKEKLIKEISNVLDISYDNFEPMHYNAEIDQANNILNSPDMDYAENEHSKDYVESKANDDANNLLSSSYNYN